MIRLVLVAGLVTAAMLAPPASEAMSRDSVHPGDAIAGRCVLGFFLESTSAGDPHADKVWATTAAPCAGSVGDVVGLSDGSIIGVVEYRGDWGGAERNGIDGLQLDVALIHVDESFLPRVVFALRSDATVPTPGATEHRYTGVGAALTVERTISPLLPPSHPAFLVTDDARHFLAVGSLVGAASGAPVVDVVGGRAAGHVTSEAWGCCANDLPYAGLAGPTMEGMLTELSAMGYSARVGVAGDR